MRQALRALLKSPGFTFAAVAALALGIAANTAIFSLVHGVLLRPLPYHAPEQIVRVWATAPERGLDRTAASFIRFQALQAATTDTFAHVGASTFATLTLTGRGDAEQLLAQQVSAGFFAALGLQPRLGRTFTPVEDAPGGADVVLVSEAFWRARLGGRDAAIGETLVLDGRPHAVIGVLPPQPGTPFAQTQLWVPRPGEVAFLSRDQVARGAGYLQITARLRPGATLAQAQAAAPAWQQRYRETHVGNVDAVFGLEVISFTDELVGNQRRPLGLLVVAVGCVLLIACANVANLQLARIAGRRREIAVRTALGATRWHLLRQFLAESLLLSFVACVLGLLLAGWGLDLLLALARDFLPRATQVSLDATAVGFSVLLALLTGFALGCVPALQAGSADVRSGLHEGARGTSGGPLQRRFRQVFVGVEFALSLVLLIGAALLVSSFLRLQRVDPGFDPRRTLEAFIAMPLTRYDTEEKQAAFYDRILARLAQVPGVERVALSDTPPFSGNASFSSYAVQGTSLPPIQERPLAERAVASPGYFATLGITVREGRAFEERDRAGAPLVVVINQTMARQLFPDRSPLGQHLILGMAQRSMEIIGVVDDTRTNSLIDPPRAQMFYAVAQHPTYFTGVVVRATRDDPTTLVPSFRAALRELDADVPFVNPQPIATLVAQSVADRRLLMWLLALFAGVAGVLAIVGIYSVTAFGVAQRTREIGIRIALGATSHQVNRLLVRQALQPAACGMLVGLVAAFALSRLLGALLVDVSATDPFVYTTLPLLLGAVATTACFIPARRATRMDPVVALRAE